MENLNEYVNVAYSNNAIRKTKGERDQVRERASMFFGTDDVYGAVNAVMEIVVNGADEIGQGYGDTITVMVDEDYNIAVSDNGRGVPMDWNEDDQKYNWDLVYNQMYASGKRSPGAYDNAAGLNGVGASITQFTSLYMKVISRRIEEDVAPDGTKKLVKREFEMNFKDGYPVGELIRRDWNPNATSSGTIVMFKTDPTRFQETRFTVEMIAEKLRKLATVQAGSHYMLMFADRAPIEFCYDGPNNVLDQMVPDKITGESVRVEGKKLVREAIRGREEEFEVSMDFAFTFSPNGSFKESYHNGLYLVEHGTSVEGFKSGVMDVIEAWGKNNGKLNQKDKIVSADIDEIICFIVTTKFRGDLSAWDGQDKKAIRNLFLKPLCEQLVTDKFSEWASSHGEVMGKLLDTIVELKTARAKAAMYKASVVKRLSAGVDSFKNRPDSLTDCLSRDTRENEIILVEGDSAKGSVVMARNKFTQAVYALRGKVLNCRKATIDAIFHNKIIMELIQTFGCGVEIRHKYIKDLPKFDITKLNYGKIIISTDADVDGLHIQCLLITLIFRLMPSLIKEHKVYILNAPLYLIEYTIGAARDKRYAYSDEERDGIKQILVSNGAKNINVKRFKGLGEMNPEQFAESTLDPKIRNLTLVEWPEDEEAFAKMLDATMGDNLSERKALIEEYFGREAEGVELGDLDLDSDMDLGGVEDGLSEEEAEENKYVEAVVE